MVAERECEAIWKNDIGNYRSEHFSTVNDILKFSMSLIAGNESLCDTHINVPNMLSKVKKELGNLYDFIHMKDFHP